MDEGGWSESIQPPLISTGILRFMQGEFYEYQSGILQGIYYVCQEGSLTAAAQRLCISQPAVSQAVRQLEKEAGQNYFPYF